MDTTRSEGIAISGVMVDDHLLRDFLVQDVPLSVREILLDAPAVMTTDLMVVRLAGAVFKARSGSLAGALSPEQEHLVVESLIELPPAIQVWGLAGCMVRVARLSVDYSISTWLALGLEGARVNSLYFGADERNIGRHFLSAAAALDVPVLLVDENHESCRVVKP
jgi:hypothetical protein